MAEFTIGSAFVEIASRGMQQVEKDLAQVSELSRKATAPAVLPVKATGVNEVKKQLDSIPNNKTVKAKVEVEGLTKLNAGIQQMGAMATKVFVGGTAAIGGFVRMADPKGFEDMQVAVAKLSIQIGRFFVPLLRQATEGINRLVTWFKNLTDSQREQVLRWTKITLAVSGTLMVLPKLISLFGAAAGVVKLFAASLTILGASSPVGWIIGLGVALVGLLAVLGRSEGSKFAETWTMLKNLFRTVFDAIKPVVELIGTVLASAFRMVMSIVGAVVQVFAAVFVPAFKVVASVVQAVVQVISNVLVPIFEFLVRVITEVVGFIVGILAPAFEFIGNVIQAVVPYLMALVVFLVSFKVAALAGAAASALLAYAMTAWGASAAVAGAASTVAAGGVATLAGAMTALKGALLALLANPFALAIAAIATAVMALSGAFSSASTNLADLLAKADQLEAIKERLEKGGKVTKKDVDKLDNQTREALAKAKTADERRKALDEGEARAREMAQSGTNINDEQKVKVQAALEQAGIKTMTHNMLRRFGSSFRDRTEVRKEAVEGALGRKLSKDETKKFEGIVEDGGLIGSAKKTLTDEDIQKVVKMLGSEQTIGEGRLEIIKALKEGREEKKGDEYRGEVRQQPAQLMAVAEAWRKIQTSGGEDPASRIAREQLEQAKGARQGIDKIVENTTPKNPWDMPGGKV